MRPRPLCNKLNEFLTSGFERGVFQGIQYHRLDNAGEIASLSPVSEVGMVSADGISIKDYLDILDGNKYTAVFSDGGLVMIQCTFVNDVLDTHRYSYIPCPFDRSLFLLRPDDVPVADWVREIMLTGESSSFRSTGTYRFDCVRVDSSDATDPHPVSHLTFGSADCRLPVRGPLSVADFLNFVFDNFYREYRPVWLPYAYHLRCLGTEATITSQEQMMHHLHWQDEN